MCSTTTRPQFALHMDPHGPQNLPEVMEGSGSGGEIMTKINPLSLHEHEPPPKKKAKAKFTLENKRTIEQVRALALPYRPAYGLSVIQSPTYGPQRGRSEAQRGRR